MRKKRAVWILIAAVLLGLWGCGSTQPVTVTVDRSFTDLETQEDCDRLASEKGYESVTLSEDASEVIYGMSPARHKELVRETGEKIDAAVNKMVESEDYSFESITVSDDYMTYEAVLDKKEADVSDQLMALTFYYAAEMYRQFAGMESAHLSVVYKDKEGKVLYEDNFDLGGSGENGKTEGMRPRMYP